MKYKLWCMPSIRARIVRWVGAGVMATAIGGAAVAQVDVETTAALDAKAGVNRRTQAVDRVWAEVEAGKLDRAAGRETLKQILWKGGAPELLREHVFKKLVSDATPEGRADTRNFIRLRMPTESQWPLIDAMCKEIALRAADPDGSEWRQVAPALVRSYARKVPVPPDADRPERDALLALFAGEPIERIVFGVYLDPEMRAASAATTSKEIVEKQRQAAWELLGRLDPDGARRRDFLTTAPADNAGVASLARLAKELRVVPVTGSELAWANGLMDSAEPGAESWWAGTREAVSRLTPEQVEGLQMRHLEPVRWAAAHHSEWIAASREGLLSELGGRLEPRRKWRKSEGLGSGETQSPELLSDWDERLVWGDVLTILVIDEALKDPRVIEALFVQAAADRSDTSTEYGGLLFATDAVPMLAANGTIPMRPKWEGVNGTSGFVVKGYSARPAQRVNDRTFVAPDDMFHGEGAGGRALAHFHFHAQSVNNSDYAGPGYGDHEYAANHGRACVVLTSVRPGVLNADYYQRAGRTPPDAAFLGAGKGIQIDLGEVVSSR